jgi:hypothetical protein
MKNHVRDTMVAHPLPENVTSHDILLETMIVVDTTSSLVKMYATLSELESAL